jgi:hypothetical protein
MLVCWNCSLLYTRRWINYAFSMLGAVSRMGINVDQEPRSQSTVGKSTAACCRQGNHANVGFYCTMISGLCPADLLHLHVHVVAIKLHIQLRGLLHANNAKCALCGVFAPSSTE